MGMIRHQCLHVVFTSVLISCSLAILANGSLFNDFLPYLLNCLLLLIIISSKVVTSQGHIGLWILVVRRYGLGGDISLGGGWGLEEERVVLSGLWVVLAFVERLLAYQEVSLSVGCPNIAALDQRYLSNHRRFYWVLPIPAYLTALSNDQINQLLLCLRTFLIFKDLFDSLKVKTRSLTNFGVLHRRLKL